MVPDGGRGRSNKFLSYDCSFAFFRSPCNSERLEHTQVGGCRKPFPIRHECTQARATRETHTNAPSKAPNGHCGLRLCIAPGGVCVARGRPSRRWTVTKGTCGSRPSHGARGAGGCCAFPLPPPHATGVCVVSEALPRDQGTARAPQMLHPRALRPTRLKALGGPRRAAVTARRPLPGAGTVRSRLVGLLCPRHHCPPGLCLKGRALWGQTQSGNKAVGAHCKIGWGVVTGGWKRGWGWYWGCGRAFG